MPTITIPASEIRRGDVLNIGGDLRPVRIGHHTVDDEFIVYVDGPFSAIHFPATLTVAVYRDDPDDEVIEAMAGAIHPWVSSVHQVAVARAALAAYREHNQA